MGELGALFNPGMRHEQEERRAKALRREEEGDSRDFDPRIDLESGVAVITTDDQDSAQPSPAADGSQPEPERPESAVHPASTDDDGAGRADSEESDAPGADQGGPEAGTPAAPARPRPRGKRGLAARSR